jgi:hypothetical protein
MRCGSVQHTALPERAHAGCLVAQATVQPPLHALLRAAAPVPLVGTVLEKTVEVLESTLGFHAYTTSG